LPLKTVHECRPTACSNTFQSNVPPHLVQRWLGNASLRTTSIYGNAIRPEERAFAARMWGRTKHEDTSRVIPR
jgi:hypothetical protein